MASPVEQINKAIFLHQQGNLGDAEAIYKKVLRVHAKNFDALHMLGIINAQRGSFEDAEKFLRKALSADSKVAPCFHNHGTILCKLKRFKEAIESYNSAIKLAPNHAPIYSDRGHALYELKRYDEALAAYDKALALKPDLADAWCGRGNVFNDLKRYDEAFAAYDKALALKPDLANVWLGRGNVFLELKRHDEAFAAYDKALALKPDLEKAWLGRGNVFLELKRHDEAFAAYDKAFSLKPDLAGVEGSRLHAKMHLCDWSNFDAECNHLIASVRNGKNSAPLTFLAIPSSSEDQLQSAKLWIGDRHPPSGKPIWQGDRYDHDRIRIAYVSADFHEHPMSFLMAGTFECHDKSVFDVTAISLRAADNSEMRQRLKPAFEHFIDAENYSDDQIANLVRSSELDILVDLMGFTADLRTGIFARRAAPNQVNYLGYPGTMGAEYIDYIVADRLSILETQHQFYSEKIVYLPNTFQPTDRGRPISDTRFSRVEVGLPQEGFVFCCFSNNYKITPDVFDIWMRILENVKGSVLWLFVQGTTIERNLRNEAAKRGVRPERLIFASRMPLAEHQARLRLADLFLDTWPYNAGATASDMLWAGLPVLTRTGETFVSRMAASVLNAVALPELITTTPEGYEQLAIELATHPEQLTVIKHKLSDNRLTTPLFDTKLFTKHLELAYIVMHQRYQAGLEPDHIFISN